MVSLASGLAKIDNLNIVGPLLASAIEATTITTTTPDLGDNSLVIATTAFVQRELQNQYGNVNNTSDLNKPISTAVQTALDKKQDSGITKSYNYNLSTSHLPIQLDGLLSDRVISNITVDSSGIF